MCAIFLVDDCFGRAKGINNMMFSTKDQDHDVWPDNCAEVYQSGWWHNECHCANPNGVYLAGSNSKQAVGITYEPWRSNYYSLKSTQLMVRRILKEYIHLTESRLTFFATFCLICFIL